MWQVLDSIQRLAMSNRVALQLISAQAAARPPVPLEKSQTVDQCCDAMSCWVSARPAEGALTLTILRTARLTGRLFIMQILRMCLPFHYQLSCRQVSSKPEAIPRLT
jgi:hypothetical protein